MALEYKDSKALLELFEKGEVYLTEMVVGRIGTGKTHYAMKHPSPMIICTDSNVIALKGAQVDYIEVKSLDDISAVVADAINQRGPFANGKIKTVVLDGLSECTDLAKQKVAKDGKMSLQTWGYASDAIRMMMKEIISLRTMYHIVVTAKATLDKREDEGGGYYGVPDTIGKFQHLVGGMFNIVFYATQKTEFDATTKKFKPKYELHTTEFEMFSAVDRTGKLDVVEPNDYDVISKKLYGGST